MKPIEQIRSDIIEAYLNAKRESGDVRIMLSENSVTITFNDKYDMTVSYGNLIELYKMLQELYGDR